MTDIKEVKEEKVPTVNPQVGKSKKPSEKELKWEADKDRELVSGIFKFHESPGETLKFWFRAHPGDDIERYELRDGEQYKLPLAVARHLNKNCWYGVDQFALDPKTGIPTTEVGKKVRRCSFYTIGYVDIEDLSEVGTAYIAPK